MHFKAIEDSYRDLNANEIRKIDALLFAVYNHPQYRKRFTLHALKTTFHAEDNAEVIIESLVLQGYLRKTFETRCPECGKTVKRYKFGDIKAMDELMLDPEQCECGEFIPTAEDILVTYAFDHTFLPTEVE